MREIISYTIVGNFFEFIDINDLVSAGPSLNLFPCEELEVLYRDYKVDAINDVLHLSG